MEQSQFPRVENPFDILNQKQANYFNSLKDPEGARCPTCHRWGKFHPVAFQSGFAKALIFAHRYTLGKNPQDGWFHFANALSEFTGLKIVTNWGYNKLKYWDLIEEKFNDDSKKKQSGFYRITPKGVRVVLNQEQIPKKLWRFDNKTVAISPEMIYCRDGFKDHFDYEQLMKEGMRFGK